MSATLHRGFGSSGIGVHEKLNIGDIIQVLLKPSYEETKFIASSMCERGTPYFFVIGGFFLSHYGHSWALCKRCELIHPTSVSQLPSTEHVPYLVVNTDRFYDEQESTPHYYLELKSGVTKVGVFHNCEAEGKCNFSTLKKRVEHSHTTIDGGSFFILTRSMAFPPRRS